MYRNSQTGKRSESLVILYNRYSTEPTDEGFRIHIEIHVQHMKDAINIMNTHARQITEELKQVKNPR